MERKVIGIIMVALVVGLVIGGAIGWFIKPTEPSISTETIKVGYAGMLTGMGIYEGREGLDGLTLAVEEVNDAGGLLGHKLEIIPGDVGEREPLTVDSVFKKLILEAQVDVILAGTASYTSFEVEICNDYGVPYILAGTSSQTYEIIGENGEDFPFVCSFAPLYTAYHTIPEYVEMWEENGDISLPTKTVAIITRDSPYCRYIAEGLKDNFNERGWTITIDETVPAETISDWTVIIAKIRNNPPDLIVNTDNNNANEAAFLTQFLENPTNSLLFIQFAPSTAEFLELTGDKANGVFYNFPWLTTRENPLHAETEDKFKERWGYTPTAYGHVLYWELQAYMEAVRKVGDYKDKARIAEAIGETSIYTSQGLIEFDQKTHLAKVGEDLLPPCYWQVQNGERILLNTKHKMGDFEIPPWFK